MSSYRAFFNSLPSSSGSPLGLSHYAALHECAYREVQPREQSVATPEGTQDPLSVGVYYHALWDHRPELSVDGDLTDDMVEALRLWRGYRNAWGTPEERFGLELVAREEPLDLGWITARLDTVYRVVWPEKLVAYGILVPAGTTLLHDHKTSGSIRPPDYYICGLQGRFYPTMWNERYPRNRVDGILFDEIVKHVNLRKIADKKGGASFNVHWAATPMDEQTRRQMLREWVTVAQDRERLTTKNYASCVDSYGHRCPFYSRCHAG